MFSSTTLRRISTVSFFSSSLFTINRELQKRERERERESEKERGKPHPRNDNNNNNTNKKTRKKIKTVKAGDRVAQLILERIATPAILEVDDLDDTARGAGGYGSTGVKS